MNLRSRIGKSENNFVNFTYSEVSIIRPGRSRLLEFEKKIKPLQNKKGQKNLGYPRKKQSFYKEKDCFFLGYPKFFWPFLL